MRLTILALACTALAAARPQGPPPQRPEPPKVRVSLVSELDALRGGEEFLVGLRMKMAPHWHIYWKNPGDSGIPTRATLDAPEGFEVGPLLFPGPERFELPGGIVNFGYEGETVLFWRVTAPEELGDATRFTFEAHAEWLVCKEICLPGEGEDRSTLRAAQQDEEVARDRSRFGDALERLPRTLDTLEGASAQWERGDDGPLLVARVPGAAALRWFPEREGGLDAEREATERAESGSLLRRWYSLSPSDDQAKPGIRGLLAVERDGEVAFYELELGRPSAAEEEETR